MTDNYIRMNSARPFLLVYSAALFFLLFSPAVWGTPIATPAPPEIGVEAAVLLDFDTGKVLFSKHPDKTIPPASLTKLMTLYVLLNKIDHGELSENELAAVPEPAYASNMPPRSSLMFLGPRQRVSLLELMKGLAVSSGNDAAVAAALIGAGSIPDFVSLMNGEADRLGFDSLYFEEPAGLSAGNRITPLEFARFCRIYIREHPQTLEEIHSLKEFTYPKQQNSPDGNSFPIKQYNRNRLLWRYPGVDGLKTGYIDESGFNLALTAAKGGMRLIAVLLGGEGSTAQAGLEGTARDGAALLDFGFDNFVTVRPERLNLEPVRIWKGKRKTIPITTAEPVMVTVPKTVEEELKLSISVEHEVEAPGTKGEKVGALTVKAADETVGQFDVVLAQSVERGSIFRVVWDTCRLWWHRNIAKK